MSTSGGSSGGIDPTTASRLIASSPAQGGIASATTVDFDWTSEETVGTDITIPAGAPNKRDIKINDDGLYAFYFRFDANGTGAALLTYVQSFVQLIAAGIVSGFPPDLNRGLGAASPETEYGDTYGGTYFLPTNALLRAKVYAEINLGTWSLAQSYMTVQRVA